MLQRTQNNKFSSLNYILIWIIAIVFVAILGLIDIYGKPLWGLGELTSLYGTIYWLFVGLSSVMASLVHYVVRKDLSEMFATFIIFFGLAYSGLEDIFFYFFEGGFPASMNHLYNHITLGILPRILGLQTVTPFTLIFTVMLSIPILVLVSIVLIKKL